MPRPIQYDRQAVLDQAMRLFWDQGYEATSLEDVLRVTGFNRHSLYAAFGGKDGLYLEALKNYEQTFVDAIGKALTSGEGGLDAVRNLFAVRLPHDVAGRGCLMTNTINEREHVAEAACSYAKGFNRRLEEGIRRALERAQRQGDVPAHKDAAALAKYVLLVLQGLGTMSRAGISPSDADAAVAQTLAFLKSPC